MLLQISLLPSATIRSWIPNANELLANANARTEVQDQCRHPIQVLLLHC